MTLDNRDHKMTLTWQCLFVKIIVSQIGPSVVWALLLPQTILAFALLYMIVTLLKLNEFPENLRCSKNNGAMQILLVSECLTGVKEQLKSY